SDERKRRSYTHRLLFKLLEMTPPYLPFACRVTKPFDESDASQIREFVTNCKSKVIKAASFEIFEEKHFVLGLVCEEKIDEVRTWAERSNLTIYNIDGLELDYDDSRRIAGNKIVEKASQLPRSNDGLIIVRVKPLSFWGGELRNTIDMVRERLKNRPHVLGAIVYSTLGHRQEPGLRRFEGGFLRITQLSDGIIQYTLFILNLNDSQKISDATLIKVLGLR
ncbi:MAG TPA: hypothetical protein VG737_09160, partial [Cyclobacteriaceae bacterium]|nr:hypothetical protein [Cyclobacteriaceae bacterium]